MITAALSFPLARLSRAAPSVELAEFGVPPAILPAILGFEQRIDERKAADREHARRDQARMPELGALRQLRNLLDLADQPIEAASRLAEERILCAGLQQAVHGCRIAGTGPGGTLRTAHPPGTGLRGR